MMMREFITIAAGALAVVSFSTVAAAQAGNPSGGMSAAEHQQMMAGSGTPGQGKMMSDSDMHRMMAMMERCEKMMAKKEKAASVSGQGSTKKTSAEGKWAWRPNPRQAPGPRAPLLAPVRVWVPADNGQKQ